MTKILVVDDDTVLGKMYTSILTKEGFEVATAIDGEDGLSKVIEFKPDLVLSDIMMPRMDGLALLKKIKSQTKTKNIPVILMTNLKDEENTKTAISLGASNVVIKNESEPTIVINVVKEILGQSKHSSVNQDLIEK